jgi:hypothetical protein
MEFPMMKPDINISDENPDNHFFEKMGKRKNSSFRDKCFFLEKDDGVMQVRGIVELKYEGGLRGIFLRR